MPEFSKGMWRYDNILGLFINSENNNTIANARLIAAAPEMYELLTSFVQQETYDSFVTAILRNKAEELLARIHGDNMKGGE